MQNTIETLNKIKKALQARVESYQQVRAETGIEPSEHYEQYPRYLEGAISGLQQSIEEIEIQIKVQEVYQATQ